MTQVRPAGCGGCVGHGRPGYVVAWVLENDQMVPKWKRCPDRCTAESRAAAIERQLRRRAEREAEAARQTQANAAPAPAASPEPIANTPPQQAQEQTVHQPVPPRPAHAARPRQGNARPGGRRAPARAGSSSPPAANAPRRWPAVALDHDGNGWQVDIDQVPAPAGRSSLTGSPGWEPACPCASTGSTTRDVPVTASSACRPRRSRPLGCRRPFRPRRRRSPPSRRR